MAFKHSSIQAFNQATKQPSIYHSIILSFYHSSILSSNQAIKQSSNAIMFL
ncbi:hypothetical protein [Helicobacter pylori]|uniref:hypothetical protein n=1 Tax=Helicobacter pylori TaxID=210 RepID=UPI0013043BF0|nr:hypothetical protein [Helicobacter pylori]